MNNERNKIWNSNNNPLFRKEVLAKNKNNYLGKTIVIAPISFFFWSIGIFSMAIALGLFLYFGKYTKRQEVHGMLVPDKGLINIYAEKPGIVISKFTQQGDEVEKGQLLYLISTEQHTLTDQSVSAKAIESLEKQIEIQKSRVSILEKNLERYKQLLDKQYVSEADYQNHEDSYLSAKLSLHDLESRLNQAKGTGDYAIRAPSDGIISTSVAMIGDRVAENKILISIIPKGAMLQGVLYVPTHSIGFVKMGQKVLLKYQAYPYQQFGLYESTVNQIDKSILSSEDIKTPINLNVPFYRVIVSLRQQTVSVYGKAQTLTVGMLFDATILSEKCRIWQWIVRPIYSLKGELIT